MIPKIIHYCWFSNEKKTKSIKKCIESWQKIMPEYKIRCWDGNSFDFDSVPFVHDAMAAKKYAFAADYVRLFALYTEGGIYLDSDVLVKKSFDPFLNNDFFCGTEAYIADNLPHYRMEAAIMGATRNNPFVNECLSFYKKASFSKSNALSDLVMPAVISKYAEKYGYRYDNQQQHLSGITIYPTSFFTNTLLPDASAQQSVYAIHQNAGSWIDYPNRGRLFHFCKKRGIMSFYHWIEKIK